MSELIQRRVVVTGIGLICGVGKTAPEVWEGLLAGKSGMAEIKAFDLTGHPVRFAAEVKDFDPLVFIEKKESRKMGRFIHFAVAAADEATETACTSGAHAIGDAFRIIQRGDADAMIAGGTEAAITPMSVGGFAAMKALSTRNDDPTHACRPWDKDRDGFVVGEGAGILILEELEFAKARGAKILAEIIGYGMSADAFHMTGMAPEGEGCFRAMNAALKVAGIPASQIDYVNAHATSTPLGDAMESKAIENVFGEKALSHELLVSSTKSMTGHLLGGAGGLEAGITIMAMLDQIAPPTMNIVDLDPQCRLNYVPNTPVKAKIEYALSNSFGFGGTNGSLVFKRWTE
jgi:3-oxoacyl-[acyl-carrier-protein] synthase II